MEFVARINRLDARGLAGLMTPDHRSIGSLAGTRGVALWQVYADNEPLRALMRTGSPRDQTQ